LTASALFGGAEAMQSLWLSWVAPIVGRIVGGIIGGVIGQSLHAEYVSGPVNP
jgi:aquaporin Z